MEIPTEYSIDSRLAAQAAESQTSTNALGRETFLQLLVRQLENQNPLAPMQDQEFVSQLATFSSLEQLESINEGIQVSVLMNQAVNNSLATNLIGKEVLVLGNEVPLGAEGNASFQLELGGAADVQVVIRDAEGNVVRRLTKGQMAAGSQSIEWDGRRDDGERAAAGKYKVEVIALDAQGTAVSAQTRVRARVDGVRFVDGTGYLVVEGSTIPLSDVSEVLAPAGA